MKHFLKVFLCICTFATEAQNAVFIPDTLSGPIYSITMHPDSVQFFPGKKSHTFAYNTNKYLGPTLLFKKGTLVTINVKNLVNDTTTVHWHGIHLPAKWDGGPHSPVLPNAGWNPQFKVMDHAATFWYHPHMHMKTAEQAIKGAAGLIIVRDSAEATLLLPRKYGIDDFPLVVQCQQYDSLNQAMPLGMRDSTLLVNGTMNPYLNAPAQVVRLRLLNASGERTFNFGFSANKQFYQIASDGGLLNAPINTTRLRLSPGERGEILLNLTAMATQTLSLMCYGSELPMGIQGGPTMPMPPGSPPMDSPLNGIDYNIMKINVVSPTTGSITSIPNSLTLNTPLSESSANAKRKIRFTADSAMVMDGPFYFNDSTFDIKRIDYRIPLNSTEIWTLVNKTMVAHPFHMHDVQFFLLDRNGIAVDPQEKGRKDVVLVAPEDSVRFITKFEDFTDEQIPYMYHCHILMHEDAGMMGQFIVSSNALGIQKSVAVIDELIVYPNPGSTVLLLQINGKNTIQTYSVIDVLGKEIINGKCAGTGIERIDISILPAGVYFLRVKMPDGILEKKFIKE
ncbi:MAG: multicopper oxidase domain-containing protein [bacterium]|nr:multicopper oxidase domain-containing protein [bacterium]